MCTVSVAWQCHPKWKFIALGNRDELHARPASPIARWDDTRHIIAGRDQEAGGTWMGISEQGRFAVITNVARSKPPNPNAASRGQLLRDFLSNDGLYSAPQSIDTSAFNPFNLITVTGDKAHILSNHPDSPSRSLESGIYGLSNGTLSDPWEKSPKLDAALQNWLAEDTADFQPLIGQLQDQQPIRVAADKSANMSGPRSPEHSALFVKNSIYGTRCSSLVAVDHTGNGTFIERRFANDGGKVGENLINFSWPQ